MKSEAARRRRRGIGRERRVSRVRSTARLRARDLSSAPPRVNAGADACSVGVRASARASRPGAAPGRRAAIRPLAAALGRAAIRSRQAVDVLVGRIQRLADGLAEVEEAEQQDVGQGQLSPGDESAARDQAVEPGQAAPGRASSGRRRPAGMQRTRSLNIAQALAEAEAIGHRLDDLEVDPARPHAGIARSSGVVPISAGVGCFSSMNSQMAVISARTAPSSSSEGRRSGPTGSSPGRRADGSRRFHQVDADLRQLRRPLGQEHVDHARVRGRSNCRVSSLYPDFRRKAFVGRWRRTLYRTRNEPRLDRRNVRRAAARAPTSRPRESRAGEDAMSRKIEPSTPPGRRFRRRRRQGARGGGQAGRDRRPDPERALRPAWPRRSSARRPSAPSAAPRPSSPAPASKASEPLLKPAAKAPPSPAVSPLAVPFPRIPPIAGVEIATGRAGFYKHERDDLLLMRFAEGATCAGVFTRHGVGSAPVDWCKRQLEMTRRRGRPRAGGQRRLRQLLHRPAGRRRGAPGLPRPSAKRLDCRQRDVMVASTGVIGVLLDDAKIIHTPAGHRRAADRRRLGRRRARRS